MKQLWLICIILLTQNACFADSEILPMLNGLVIYGQKEDKVLSSLVEMTIIDIDGQPLFASPMDEPLFYRRHFRAWVSGALLEREQTEGIYDEIMTKALEINPKIQ